MEENYSDIEIYCKSPSHVLIWHHRDRC